MPTDPTPELLAAADAIDVSRYEGYDYRWSPNGPPPTQSQVQSAAYAHGNAHLVPALIFQRDEARRERDEAMRQLATAATMLLALSDYLKQEGLNYRPSAMCADDCKRIAASRPHACTCGYDHVNDDEHRPECERNNP